VGSVVIAKAALCALSLKVGQWKNLPTRNVAHFEMLPPQCAKIEGRAFQKWALGGQNVGSCTLSVTWINRPEPTQYKVCVSPRKEISRRSKVHQRKVQRPQSRGRALEIPGWDDNDEQIK
jgi:hypothetical protein